MGLWIRLTPVFSFWLTDRRLFAFAVVLYGLSAVYSFLLWRRGFREDNRINYCLLVAAFFFHTLAMFQRGFSLAQCPVNNLYEATIFVEWTIVATYLVIGVWSRLRFLGAFASPILFSIGVFALMPDLDRISDRPQFGGGLASLHAALILLAYGAFGISSIAGLMYLTQEHDLKVHKLRAIVSLMPPIERLELAISRLLAAGFVLLTVGLALGAYYLKREQGVYYTGDAKIFWSVFVWLLYFGLLLMRWQFAQKGRRFVWGAVAGFAFVLLTFWGTNLLSAIHQQ